MSRLTPLSMEELSADQRAVLDAINAGPRGKRGQIGLIGPFGVWVRAPRLGMPAQNLGASLRFETSLPQSLKEIAICTVGAHYRAKFEFAAHAPLAIAAGVAPPVIEAIRLGETPDFDKDDEELSYRVATELLEQHGLSNATYARAKETFGENGLIELVTVIGYYCMVSLTLNAFQIPLPETMDDPFPEQQT